MTALAVGSGRPTRRKKLEAQLFAALRCHKRLVGTPAASLRLVVAEIIQELLEVEEAPITDRPPENSYIQPNAKHQPDSLEENDTDLDPLPGLEAEESSRDLHECSRPGAAIIEESRLLKIQAVGIVEFLKRINDDAAEGGLKPSIGQAARSYAALNYAIGDIPFAREYNVTTAAAELGCSKTLFHRLVQRWCRSLRISMPHGKPRKTTKSQNENDRS